MACRCTQPGCELTAPAFECACGRKHFTADAAADCCDTDVTTDDFDGS